MISNMGAKWQDPPYKDLKLGPPNFRNSQVRNMAGNVLAAGPGRQGGIQTGGHSPWSVCFTVIPSPSRQPLYAHQATLQLPQDVQINAYSILK